MPVWAAPQPTPRPPSPAGLRLRAAGPSEGRRPPFPWQWGPSQPPSCLDCSTLLGCEVSFHHVLESLLGPTLGTKKGFLPPTALPPWLYILKTWVGQPPPPPWRDNRPPCLESPAGNQPVIRMQLQGCQSSSCFLSGSEQPLSNGPPTQISSCHSSGPGHGDVA